MVQFLYQVHSFEFSKSGMKNVLKPSVAHICNPSTQEAKRGQPRPCSTSPARATQQEPVSNRKYPPPSKKKQKGEAMAWNIIFVITSKNLLKLQLLLIVSHF